MKSFISLRLVTDSAPDVEAITRIFGDEEIMREQPTGAICSQYIPGLIKGWISGMKKNKSLHMLAERIEGQQKKIVGYTGFFALFQHLETNRWVGDATILMDSEEDQVETLKLLLQSAFTPSRSDKALPSAQDYCGHTLNEVMMISRVADHQIKDLVNKAKLPHKLQITDSQAIALYWIPRDGALGWLDGQTSKDRQVEPEILHTYGPHLNLPGDEELSLAKAARGGKIELQPMNLHDQSQFLELQRQRRICGWKFSDEEVTKWRNMADRPADGSPTVRETYWIVMPDIKNKRVGHIGIDLEPETNGRVRRIVVLFVLPHFGGGGVAHKAMDVLENRARADPTVDRLVLDTRDERYWHETSSLEFGGDWLRTGLAEPRGDTVCSADWYGRRGYKMQRSRWTYPHFYITGQPVRFHAVEGSMDVASH